WKYTAPERFTAPVVNHEVDIYALTCVLHECLTGSPPYWADDVGALISAHLRAPIPRPSQLQTAIPSAFDDVIARGMAKDPLKRYARAGDLAMAAYHALSGPDQERVAAIVKSSGEATRPDGEFEPSSGPSASPRRDQTTDAASPPDSPRMPDTLPRFGLEDGGWPSEIGTPPPGPRPPWTTPRKQRPWPL